MNLVFNPDMIHVMEDLNGAKVLYSWDGQHTEALEIFAMRMGIEYTLDDRPSGHSIMKVSADDFVHFVLRFNI